MTTELTKAAQQALEACPFCGSKNIKVHSYSDAAIGGEPDAFAQCHDCSVTGPNGKTEAEASEAWNTRALTQRPAPAPAPAVPSGMLLVSADLIRRAQHAINWHLEPNSPDEHEATMRELAGLLTAAPTPPAQTGIRAEFLDAHIKRTTNTVGRMVAETADQRGADAVAEFVRRAMQHVVDLIDATPPAQSESPCSCWPGRMCSRSAQCARDFQPAVPEDVARVPMTQRWCWWIGDAETFHIADTESEAHVEARCRIDDDCEPGDTREYSVGRVQHPIDALGMDWLAEHVAETIEENTREWCDDNTGAEDQSITLSAEDRKVLGTMVAAFLREKAAVHWWTADQKTITTHTYVSGSSDDAARAAEKGGE